MATRLRNKSQNRQEQDNGFGRGGKAAVQRMEFSARADPSLFACTPEPGRRPLTGSDGDVEAVRDRHAEEVRPQVLRVTLEVDVQPHETEIERDGKSLSRRAGRVDHSGGEAPADQETAGNGRH